MQCKPVSYRVKLLAVRWNSLQLEAKSHKLMYSMGRAREVS